MNCDAAPREVEERSGSMPYGIELHRDINGDVMVTFDGYLFGWFNTEDGYRES